MAREGFTVPLLIGGATTSRAHTAVKIAPNYPGPVVYVPDASRSVGVMQNLLADAEQRAAYLDGLAADYEKIRAQHRNKKGPGPLLPLSEARRLGMQTDWSAYRPPAPRRPGDPAVLYAAADRARNELGWRPRYADLEVIVRHAWQWHSTHPAGYAA